ncbi:MAG: PfkB family carbohydrate kinase [Acidobacteria bacterium]|nr:PfkB family carbohydrate kinase [Acidobacteriota bacterium]
MGRVWIVGPVALDWVLHVSVLPRSGEFVQGSGFLKRPGGAGSNVAIALASAGCDVSIVGYVGDDSPGKVMVSSLIDAGVKTHFLRRFDGPTSEVMILIDSTGERTMLGIHQDQLARVGLPVDQVSRDDIVYYAAWHGKFARDLERLECTVVAVPPQGGEHVASSHFLVGSESEFSANGLSFPSSFTGLAPVTAGVLVTRGSAGVSVYEPTYHYEEPAIKVKAVDTTGAGDAFAAGMLLELSQGRELRDAVKTGIRWGGLTAASYGSIPPPLSPVSPTTDAGARPAASWRT